MHSCWSPVPKCRPSFQQLVVQLERLHLNLSPAFPPSLYVNLEGDEELDRREGAGGPQELARSVEPEAAAEASSWSVPWQRQVEDGETDWLIGASRAALAMGGDYRYVVKHCGPLEEEVAGGGRLDQARDDDDEDDAVINV